MGKYIDAEKLKKEIERRIKESNIRQANLEAICQEGADVIEGPIRAILKSLLSFIASLQQEQPTVDLEKFISDFIDKKDSENQDKWCEEDIIEAMKSSFNLGLNARKEE